jgi:hypothetical protein
MIGYKDAQRASLIGLYKLLAASERQEWFSASDIRAAAQISAGAAFVSRILIATEESDGYVASSSHDDETLFALEQEGFSFVESLIEGDVEQYKQEVSSRSIILSSESAHELTSLLSEVLREVRRSNEIGGEIGATKGEIINELSSASALIDGKEFRSRALLALVWKPLKFLSEKFTGTAVGELAKKLMAELWKSII